MTTHYANGKYAHECDFCGSASFQVEGDWTRVTRNDGTWDLCPRCLANAKEGDWLRTITNDKSFSVISNVWKEDIR